MIQIVFGKEKSSPPREDWVPESLLHPGRQLWPDVHKVQCGGVVKDDHDSHDADDDANDDEIYLVAIAGSRRHYHQLVANEEFPEFVLESSGTGRRSEIAWTRLGGRSALKDILCWIY